MVSSAARQQGMAPSRLRCALIVGVIAWVVIVARLAMIQLVNAPRLAECDAVVAMYHDQGLPVLKHMGFGRSVNITLGLPFIRTSVDHGTALDIAGTGRADASSLFHAIRTAQTMVEASA